MPRHANQNWDMPKDNSWDVAKLAVLMDIRDELQKLNRVFACPNFLDVPHTLRRMSKHLAGIKRLAEAKK